MALPDFGECAPDELTHVRHPDSVGLAAQEVERVRDGDGSLLRRLFHVDRPVFHEPALTPPPTDRRAVPDRESHSAA